MPAMWNASPVVMPGPAPSRSTARTASTMRSAPNRDAARRRAGLAHARGACSSSFRISIVRAAMPSMSPTGSRKPGLGVLHDLGQAARVRADDRHPARHGLQRGQPERLELGRQEEDVRQRGQLLDAVLPAQEAHAVLQAQPAAPAPGRRRARALRRPSAARPAPRGCTRSKMRTTSTTRFTGRKFETCSRIFCSGRADEARSRSLARAVAAVDREVDEVRDDLDVLLRPRTRRRSCASGTRRRR